MCVCVSLCSCDHIVSFCLRYTNNIKNYSQYHISFWLSSSIASKPHVYFLNRHTLRQQLRFHFRSVSLTLNMCVCVLLFPLVLFPLMFDFRSISHHHHHHYHHHFVIVFVAIVHKLHQIEYKFAITITFPFLTTNSANTQSPSIGSLIAFVLISSFFYPLLSRVRNTSSLYRASNHNHHKNRTTTTNPIDHHNHQPKPKKNQPRGRALTCGSLIEQHDF